MDDRTVILDSSVLVAFYLENDSCHTEAVAIVSEIEQATLLLHPYVVQEVVSVLAYKAGVPLAKKFILDIQSAVNVVIVTTSVTQEMDDYMILNTRLSFTDSALLSLASARHLPLVTFDKQLRVLAKKLGR